ncbi:MAG: HlyC/CorC family transporter [Phycisphaerales bacterium]|nr:HlyC/CorC family transporter [Phycisphaerales bacterium]
MNSEWWFWIALTSLVLGAVFSALFHSLREMSRPALESLAHSKSRPEAAERVRRILEDVDGHAAAVAMPRILFNMAVAISSVFWIASVRGVPAATWKEVVIGLLVSSLLLWVFGMAVPHAVAKHAGAETVYAWSGPVRGLRIISSPLIGLVRFFDEVVRRLAGKIEVDEAEAREEELLSVIQEARQEGQFDEAEQQMIEAVVRFKDRTVGQIMTPRTEIEAIELTNNLGDLTQYIRRGGHSRIPVYEESLDHIAGIFYVKDLMRWLAGEGSRGGRTFDLKAILRPAHFVPESKTIRELLTELLDKRVHIAIVADEYGGTSGLVTFEDIVEEVFGDIQDEYERVEDEVPDIRFDRKTRAARVDARVYIRDLNAALRPFNTEIPESEDYDTLGGFVTVSLGRIPAAGDELRHERVFLKVLEAEPTRVKSVRLEVTEQPEQPEETESREAAEAADAAAAALERPQPGIAEAASPGADAER